MSELADPALILINLGAILLVISVMMRTLRDLRILALVAGLLLLAHFAIHDPGHAGLLWSMLFVIANGGLLAASLYRARRGVVTREERSLLEEVLRVEEPEKQRRLLDLMTWRDVPVGEVLMREGEKEPPLIYIASGAATISHEGRLVGVCGAGDFLGEMSMITGQAASATVEVTNPVRIARFDRDALTRMSAGMPELARAFDHALNRGLASKILRMNEARPES